MDRKGEEKEQGCGRDGAKGGSGGGVREAIHRNRG